MSLCRVVLCLIFPPLGVYDRGCGIMLLVFVLTCVGWLPGFCAAIAINMCSPE